MPGPALCVLVTHRKRKAKNQNNLHLDFFFQFSSRIFYMSASLVQNLIKSGPDQTVDYFHL